MEHNKISFSLSNASIVRHVTWRNILNNKPQTGYSYNISPWQQQYGYGLNPFIGKYRQQGYGIGNILGSLFKTVVPCGLTVIECSNDGVLWSQM